MFLTGLGLATSFTIVNKYSIYTYVQFLLTKHACDERLCNIFLASWKTGNAGIYLFIVNVLVVFVDKVVPYRIFYLDKTKCVIR